MIRNERQFRESVRRLEEERKRLEQHRMRLEKTGLSGEEIARALAPLRSFHGQLTEEVDCYERLKRGDFGEYVNLVGLPRSLAALRNAKGITQHQLAERLGVHESQVSRDERNDYRGITVERMSRVLDALGVRLTSVFEQLILAALCLGTMLTPTGCNMQEGEFKREYRLQVNVGSTTYWGMGAAKFAELVDKNTSGRINVKPYYGSQLLKGAQLNSSQMVSSGAVDCAFESTINAAPVFPEMNVFAMPFFIDTYENLDRLENGETGKKIFASMRAKGLEPLAWGENGFRQLTNSRRPVRTPDDLEGLRIRVVGSPIFIDIFRQLAADPINMNWGDAVTALQQGTVDGQENPTGILTSVQIHQYNRYCTFWNYLVDPLIVYWNKKEYDAFPSDIRMAIADAALEAGRFEKALCRAGLDGAISINILKEEFHHEMSIPDPASYLEENGMELYFLSEENRGAFKKRVRPVFDKWAKRIGTDIIETAKKDMGK